MRLLQIQTGISIDIDKIEGIKSEDKGSRIFIGGKVYESILPYDTLIALIKREETIGTGKSANVDEVIKKLNLTLDKSQHFVG